MDRCWDRPETSYEGGLLRLGQFRRPWSSLRQGEDWKQRARTTTRAGLASDRSEATCLHSIRVFKTASLG